MMVRIYCNVDVGRSEKESLQDSGKTNGEEQW